MILHLKPSVSADLKSKLKSDLQAISLTTNSKEILVTSSKIKSVPREFENTVEQFWSFDTDLQLSSREYLPEKRSVKVGDVAIGGNSKNTIIIAGPCSVESEAQITESAQFMKAMGVTALRGGCFKPRTSPYSFQGLGQQGLDLLVKMREKYGLTIVTEVRDATHVDAVIEHADVIQIGAKSMYDHGILKSCGKTQKPILIKRGFGTTLQEFAQAAEFVLCGGNPNVLLCERGIRTFETKTRFTLDLCGVAWLKEHTNLPIILDPSHALGYRYGIADLSKACVAMGVDGLLLEVHPNPKEAKSDAAQQLHHHEFEKLLQEIQPVAEAVERRIV